MKSFRTAIMICLCLSSTSVFSANTKEIESSNMTLVTQLYKTVYEKKAFDKLDQFVSNDVQFYKNFSSPLNYAALKRHLIEQGASCVKLTMLPFNSILASGNKVVTLYTRSCIDQNNTMQQRRVMAITEIEHQKVSKIWVVTHDDDSPA